MNPLNENTHTRSINPEEIMKFNNYATTDEDRPNHPLEKMNSVRVPFIIENFVGPNKMNDPNCLKGIQILEVGCGVGYLSRKLAAYNATVIGLDAGHEVIKIAKQITSRFNELENRLTFICDTIEEYSINNEDKFDILILSEVLEHISNRDSFLKTCLTTLKPGGSLFISTFEKTFFSWLFGVYFFENIFKIAPSGLHDWNLFVPIRELEETLSENKCLIVCTKGFWYNYLKNRYTFTYSTKLMSYIMHVVKQVK